MRDGYAICLGPLEQRHIAERQFVSLYQSAECAVALTASSSQENQPDRAWNPSELFSRLYFETNGHALSEGISKALLNETQCWLAETNLFPGESAAAVGQTRVAYDARRQKKEFGEVRVRSARGNRAQAGAVRDPMGTRSESAGLGLAKGFSGSRGE